MGDLATITNKNHQIMVFPSSLTLGDLAATLLSRRLRISAFLPLAPTFSLNTTAAVDRRSQICCN